MTELDGMASKVLVEKLQTAFKAFKNMRTSLQECIKDDKGFLPKQLVMLLENMDIQFILH
jgi:hypothetical protein